jgi:hypothetical protein
MASVSQTSMPSCARRGTRTDGESSSSSARVAGSSLGSRTSATSRPARWQSSQPRSDQEE